MKPILFALLCFFALADFIIKDSSFGTGNVICNVKSLLNTETNEMVNILTNYGGGIDQIWLLTPQKTLRNVIASSNGDCNEVAQNPDFRGKMLLPYANRIANATYVWNGTRLYLPMNEPARNNSLHGLLYNQTMNVVTQTTGADSASLTLGFDFDPKVFTQYGYPFNLSVRIKYTLSVSGLDINVTAINNDLHWSLPFYNSWHPYFLCNEYESYVVFDKCTSWNHVDVYNDSNLYSNMIPTGRTTHYYGFNGTEAIGGTPQTPTYYDDEFKPREYCGSHGNERSGYAPALHHRILDNGLQVVLWAEADKYPFVQIFTGSEVDFDFSGIALEPMSAECDAYNNFDNLKILSGGETWSGGFGVYLA